MPRHTAAAAGVGAGGRKGDVNLARPTAAVGNRVSAATGAVAAEEGMAMVRMAASVTAFVAAAGVAKVAAAGAAPAAAVTAAQIERADTPAVSGAKSLSSTLRVVSGAETALSDTLAVSGGVTAGGDLLLRSGKRVVSSLGTHGATPGPSTRLASGGAAACRCL